MKVRRAICGVLLGPLAFAVFIVPSHAATLSPAEYRRQLDDVSTRIDQLNDQPELAEQVAAGVPDSVSVSDGGREYSLSYDWLKKQLKLFEQADSKNRSSFLQQIHHHLQALGKEAQGYEQTQAASEADHEKLNQILARREFRNTHGPTWWDVMWEKIERWISDFFERHPIFGHAGTDALHILVYAVVAAAFVMFAIWIKRRLARPSGDFAREIVPFAPSARGWAAWLADARAAGQQHDWRNAVHLAYWAGISFLEEHGAWKPDRARTPREYLCILGARKPQYPTLSALTRKFEMIWYGSRDAHAADFEEALLQLEKLGCK